MSKSMCGKNYHSIDAKGRLIIPSKLREALGTEFYMAPGIDDYCIDLYPEEEWEKYMDSLNQLSNSEDDVREMKRYLRANAVNCTIDSQGRTVVPLELREDAEIDKDVVVVGNGRKAEIWQAEAWNAKNADPKTTRRRMRELISQKKLEIYG